MRVLFRCLLALAIVAALGPPVEAQTFVRLSASAISDTISSNGDSVTLTNAELGGFGSVKVQAVDSYSGTWEVQCATNGTVVDKDEITNGNFDTGSELKLTASDGTSPVTSVTDTVAIYDVQNAGGCRAIKVIATAGFAASDTVIVISATQAGGGGGGGGGGAGDASLSEQQTQTTHLSAIETATESALTTLALETGGNLASAATSLQSIVAGLQAEDDAHTNTDASFPMLCIQRAASVGTGTAGTAGDYAIPSCSVNGDILVSAIIRNSAGTELTQDPCASGTKSYIPIDITTATTTELTASLAGASTHYYVCAFHLVTDAANDVSLVDDDTDNCASVTSGLAGGLTAGEGWNLPANGGLALGNGSSPVMRTQGTNRVLCLVTSAATQLAGHIIVSAAQ